jgi:hypothetical protein
MKIIISPSKTQDREKTNVHGRDLLWPEKTNKLLQALGDYSSEEMGELMNIKGELLRETHELYSNWKSDDRKVIAIDLYKGVAFAGINYHDYNKEQKDYLDNNLLILSALYGAVSPHTLIWPYRLDMTMKPRDGTLYSYWKDEIREIFKREDLVVNLASYEFSRMVKIEKHKMLNIHFKKGFGKESKRLSSYEGKKARGEMVGILAENLAHTRERIRNLAPEGFRFDSQLSDENNYYYGLSL